LRTAKRIDNAKLCYRRARRYMSTPFEGAWTDIAAVYVPLMAYTDHVAFLCELK